MVILLALFLVSKIIHLIHLAIVLSTDSVEYRRSNPEILALYPIGAGDGAEDPGAHNLKSDCHLVIGQYVIVVVIVGLAILLTHKSNYYVQLLAWIIAGVQLCELPFRAVLPAWYLVLTSSWLLASVFFLTVLSFHNLFQAGPVLLVLLFGLPARLYFLIDTQQTPYGFLTCFILLTLAIAVMISIEVVSSAKLVFKQLFEMHRQKECFRTILSSFPEGVLISKVTRLSSMEAAEENKIRLAQSAGNAKFESNDVGGQPSVEVSEASLEDDYEEYKPPIRVDVLFMNQ